MCGEWQSSEMIKALIPFWQLRLSCFWNNDHLRLARRVWGHLNIDDKVHLRWKMPKLWKAYESTKVHPRSQNKFITKENKSEFDKTDLILAVTIVGCKLVLASVLNLSLAHPNYHSTWWKNNRKTWLKTFLCKSQDLIKKVNSFFAIMNCFATELWITLSLSLLWNGY